MAIFYQVKSAKNPKNNESTKFYARIKTTGTITSKELAERVSSRTGVSEGIITSVLCDAMNEVIDIVTMGYRVQIPSIGSIYLTLRSSSSEVSEDITDESIKGINIRMLASTYFKEKLSQKSKLVNFDKEVANSTGKTETDSTTGDDESGNDNSGDNSGTDGDEEYPV